MDIPQAHTPPQPQPPPPPGAPLVATAAPAASESTMARAIAARRGYQGSVVEEKKRVYEDTVWVARCPTCSGIAVVFRDGFDPRGAQITPADWTSLYRPDPQTPWTLPELLCGECLIKHARSAVRAAFNYNTGTFTVVGRQQRFLEQLHVESGRFVRELEMERKAKETRSRELLQLANVQGVMNHAAV